MTSICLVDNWRSIGRPTKVANDPIGTCISTGKSRWATRSEATVASAAVAQPPWLPQYRHEVCTDQHPLLRRLIPPSYIGGCRARRTTLSNLVFSAKSWRTHLAARMFPYTLTRCIYTLHTLGGDVVMGPTPVDRRARRPWKHEGYFSTQFPGKWLSRRQHAFVYQDAWPSSRSQQFAEKKLVPNMHMFTERNIV